MENRMDAGQNTMMAPGDIQGMLLAFSHDMRTPLENVIALVTLSLDKLRAETKSGAAAIAPYLQKVLIAVHDMEALTDELLESKRSSCDQESFTAQDLAESVSAAIGERAAQKGQLLHIDVKGLGGETMTGDGAALRRILMNLMSNAVKYTQEKGQISLTARKRQTGSGKIEAEFIVEDNGTGMDAAFMERMYDPLMRSSEALAGTVEGHGLGLTIVRQMTRRMNGRIEAESEPGKGTRFTLRVPLSVSPEMQTDSSLIGKNFLLAEDNDLCAEIAEEILREKGASLRRAANGAQAVELFKAFPAGTFDAILMDMRMPVMSGCAAAAQIRGMPREDAVKIPILALTAGGDDQDQKLALAAGMNGCLCKPLDLSMLGEAMGQSDAEGHWR